MPTPRTAPTKAGQIFDGYWTTTGAGGVCYYDKDMKSAKNWDRSGSVTLWAKWRTPNTVRVTFGKNGGTGGDDYVTCTEGQPMPTPRTAPTKSGWTFGGYWDTLACDAKGNPLGKQYYSASMKSVRSWDKSTATALWAKWTVRVKLGKNGGTGGDDYVTVIYGQPFPTRAMPTKPGSAFGGYFVSASSRTGQCYNSDGTGTSTMKWTTGGTPTVWALWTSLKSAKSACAASIVAPAVEAEDVLPAYCSGRLSDDSGTYELIVDEGLETGCVRIVLDSGESFMAEVDVSLADDVILVATEDGDVYELAR